MSAAELAARSSDPVRLVGQRRWWALATMQTGVFMAILDVFITNVAVPAIRADLHASFAEIQLVIAAYSIAYGVSLITGGRLGDIYGRRQMYALGMAGFVVASVLCGLAPTAATLIAARVLQGIAAALMFPQVFAMMRVSYTQAEQATAFAVMGAVLGLSAIAGQILGGFLIAFDPAGLGWRAVFLINLPIGAVALAATWAFLGESRAPGATRLDLGGVALVTVALMLLLMPLVLGREAGWPLWSLVSLAAVVPAGAAFFAQQRAVTARNGVPLLVLALFRERAFSVGIAIILVYYTTLVSFFLTTTLFLQIGLARDALHAALVLLLPGTVFLFTSIATPRLMRRYGHRLLSIGVALAALGFAGTCATALLGLMGETGIGLVPWMTITALGQGLFMTPLFGVILGSIRGAHAGSAAGVLSTMQQVGGAVGVAVVGIIFFGIVDAGAGAGVPAAASYAYALAGSTGYNVLAAFVVLALFRRLPGPART
jgi:EmrB/QacA subfamily drug resistance transporter